MAADCRRYIVPYMGWYHSTAQVEFATGPAPGGAGWRQVAAPTVRDTFAPAGCATFKASSSLISQGCALPASPEGKLLYRALGWRVYRNFRRKGATSVPLKTVNCQLSTVNCQLRIIVNCQLSIVNFYVAPPARATFKHRRPRFRGTLKTGGGVFIELPAFPWPGRLWR